MPFGTRQFSKPTPNKINIIFDGAAAILAIIGGFFMAASFISHTFSDIAVSIINLLLLPLCPVVKRMFGADLETGQKTVPIEDVKVMEEPKT